MAKVHPEATISPTKHELLQQVLAAADWFDGDPSAVVMPRRWSYRFDDPAGEVGVEVLLGVDGDRVVQVPLTYRAAPLEGGEEWFVTHMDHSVLGQRWIYDGAGDRVLVRALVMAALSGAEQERYEFEVDGVPQVVDPPVRAWGTGTGVTDTAPAPDAIEVGTPTRDAVATRVPTSAGALVLPHVVDSIGLDGRPGILGHWPDGPQEAVLAVLG